MNFPSSNSKFVAVAVVSMLLAVGFTVADAYLTPEAPIFASQAPGLPRVNNWYGFLGCYVFPHISLWSIFLGIILKARRGARSGVTLVVLAALCAGGAIAAQVASANNPSLPTQSAAEKLAAEAASTAVRYVVAPPLIEENTQISERARSITLVDQGRRCVVEVTYVGALDHPRPAQQPTPPAGWLVSKANCTPVP